MDKNKIKTSSQISLTEHLSAVLDSEAGSFEQRRVLDELKLSEDLRQKLSSYALIGEVMRTADTTVTANSGFLAGIHSQIESEDEYDSVKLETTKKVANDEGSSSTWLRPVFGGALAASIATVAFLGFQNYQSNNSNSIDNATLMTATTPSTTTSAASANSATIPSTTSLNNLSYKKIASVSTTAETMVGDSLFANEYQQADARIRMLLKPFVDSHMEFASNTTFVPSVRVIAYAN